MAAWTRLLSAILLLMSGARAIAQTTEHRVALVIGNGNYLTVGKLKNPPNDSTAMAEMLRRAGFDVVEREDVSRRAMIEATRTFTQKLYPGGVGLLYYAGHGVQAQGVNYLVPVDATLSVEDDLKYETIDLQDILGKLDDSRVRLSIVILDACRDNPFKSMRSGSRGLAMINPPAGTVIVYATAPGKVAADGNGVHSIFTAELLKAMGRPDKLLDVLEHVTDEVGRQTGNGQTPWINSSFRGDFYFIGPTTVTILPAPAAPLSSENIFWQSIMGSKNPADFEAYLKQYPDGSFVALAHNRLALMSPPPVPPPRVSAAPESKPSKPSPPIAKQSPPIPDQAPAQNTTTAMAPSSAPVPLPPIAALPAQPPAPAENPVQPPAPSEQLWLSITDSKNPADFEVYLKRFPNSSFAPLARYRLALLTAPPVLPPRVSAAPEIKPSKPSPPVAKPSPPIRDPAPAQKTMTAMAPPIAPVARPPIAASPAQPPAAAENPVQPPAPSVQPAFMPRPPDASQTAHYCNIPSFTGMETGAGAYVTIKVINIGRRCGRHVANRAQPTDFHFTISSPPSHGTLTLETSAFYYTPMPGYVGSDDFSLTASPYGSLKAVVTVTPPEQK